jgi:3'-phosphoadenosine 5'-phosphosulfate sulfotransferase (PAPS reductase)/FAD synthetase
MSLFTCIDCGNEFEIIEMAGKDKRRCNSCYGKKSEFIKGRKYKLICLQSLPLEIKIKKSMIAIEDIINQFGKDKVYISYSGGKDSTVLSHLIRQKYPDILHIFSNTTNEYPETLQHIQWEVNENGMNLKIAYPEDKYKNKFNFKKVVEKYGFPMFSKEVSCAIRTYRRAETERTKQNSLDYIERNYKKYKPYINLNISDKCCEMLKKGPARKMARKLKMECTFIGVLADESRKREVDWILHGCNYQTSKDMQSRPLSFWMEKDIYEYIEKFNVKIPKLYEMGYNRNGCMYCGFGVHHEGEANRYKKLKETHPRAYGYLVDNFKGILDECGVEY